VAAATPVASEFTQAVAAGTFVQAAFVDPNDPSTVYVTQVRAGRGKQGAPISLFTWACIHYLIRVARSSSVAKTIDVTSQHVNLTPCGCVCARTCVGFVLTACGAGGGAGCVPAEQLGSDRSGC